MLDDLVAVLAQQFERNVVGTGDMGGLELARVRTSVIRGVAAGVVMTSSRLKDP
ncbi:hypothetical protein MI149_29540 (plasmid) [Mycolicibacterium crocinum]|uniref:Uncharacterized protein n=1 Tax=Mycolicibacterium crocinum TaxID=388459 RepID=A0ABY3TWV6_9MYCO|nr:hypothetical protein [Mycolicibacterium crocinum]ULN44828.1 hypothetical protein MI149_29540 [Mycolicibacterium crocinum]